MALHNITAQRAWNVCNGLRCTILVTLPGQPKVTPRSLSGVLQVEDRLSAQASAANVSLSDNAIIHSNLRTNHDQLIPLSIGTTI